MEIKIEDAMVAMEEKAVESARNRLICIALERALEDLRKQTDELEAQIVELETKMAALTGDDRELVDG